MVEALTKILSQNIKILSKLDIIISNQKALENRVSKVEESINKNSDNNQGDEEYIKKIIKEVAKKLLEVSIYPTPDELREFTNNYMNENYDDFIKRQVTESVIKPVLTKNLKKITSKDNYSYSDNDEIEASQEAEETNKGVDEAKEVDEVEEEVDEAEVLQKEEENEIKEEDEEEGGRIYISTSTDEETKERMRRLKKQYKK
ncbi:unnamed protein product [Rhizophagus irregularis]|nr:unnamed protein product [Rhizophagus irregularis]CAB5373165.1 unnamed protein product [Rhizophagus irregularis]